MIFKIKLMVFVEVQNVTSIKIQSKWALKKKIKVGSICEPRLVKNGQEEAQAHE